MWKPELKDWEKVSIDAYKFMFEQSKIRSEEIMSESEAITERTIRLLTILMGFLSAFIGVAIKAKTSFWLIGTIALIYFVEGYLIYRILAKKKMVFRGSPPKEIFVKNIDRNDYTKDDQLAVLYYNEICRYQERIDINISVVRKRQKMYFVVLYTSLLLFTATSALIISSIIHP